MPKNLLYVNYSKRTMEPHKENKRQILCSQVAYNLYEVYLHGYKKLYSNIVLKIDPLQKKCYFTEIEPC